MPAAPRLKQLQPIRILLVDMTPMLRDIVREVLQAQPDLDIVGELPGEAPLVKAVDEGRVEVVIVGADRIGFPEAWFDLLEGRPQVKLIALLAHGRQGAICRALSQSSLNDLLDAIRCEATSP